jgi:hypothetical protein
MRLYHSKIENEKMSRKNSSQVKQFEKTCVKNCGIKNGV